MIHVYCGDGKGKTTAAVGLAVRNAGNGGRVVFAQFLKGRQTGELNIFERLPEILVMRAESSGKFTYQMTQEERAAASAANARLLEDAFKTAGETNADMLILDEVLSAAERDMIDEERLRMYVEGFPPERELVFTGRLPMIWLINTADYVTDMEKIKHPFDKGVEARRGVEH